MRKFSRQIARGTVLGRGSNDCPNFSISKVGHMSGLKNMCDIMVLTRNCDWILSSKWATRMIIASKRAFYYYELMLRIFVFVNTLRTHSVIAVFSSGRGDTSRGQDLKRSCAQDLCRRTMQCEGIRYTKILSPRRLRWALRRAEYSILSYWGEIAIGTVQIAVAAATKGRYYYLKKSSIIINSCSGSKYSYIYWIVHSSSSNSRSSEYTVVYCTVRHSKNAAWIKLN